MCRSLPLAFTILLPFYVLIISADLCHMRHDDCEGVVTGEWEVEDSDVD
jgi:hypothetical protein